MANSEITFHTVSGQDGRFLFDLEHNKIAPLNEAAAYV
jgi:hypothetical protein